jgi:uncharacterized protein
LPRQPPLEDWAGLDIRPGEGYVGFKVRVTPKASRNEIQGVRNGALRLRVQAPPAEGAANDMARDFLAEILGCPRRALSLARGHGARDKVFHVQGMTSEAILQALTDYRP